MQKLFLLTFLFFINIMTSLAQQEVAGEVLVQLKQTFNTSSNIDQLLPNFKLNDQLKLELLSSSFKVIKLKFKPNNIDKQSLIKNLKHHPNVSFVQANHLTSYRNNPKTPNDLLFSNQWNMPLIDAPQAWNYTTGGLTANSDTIVIAIIDNGFDLQHEDIKDNFWYNHSEIPNDGIDNDNNGFVDDYRGWNIIDSSNLHPIEDHGTAVSGIIGARGDNNLGVSGVNWNIKIMPLSNAISEAEVVQAYDYILKMRQKYNNTQGAEGAYVVATSIAQGFLGQPIDYPIWCNIYDVLGEANILNVAATINSRLNIDLVGDIPTSCPSDFLITVTNSTEQDKLSSNAGYGQKSIDLSAPGSGSFTTAALNSYYNFGGASAAAPHVTGAIGLLYALQNPLFAEAIKTKPKATALLIKEFILEGTEPLSDLTGKAVSEGRLNIHNSMKRLNGYFQGFSTTLDAVLVYPNPVSDYLLIDYETPNEDFTFQLYNEVGQIVTDWKVSPIQLGIKTLKVNVKKLQSGVYILVINNDKRQIVKRILVMQE